MPVCSDCIPRNDGLSLLFQFFTLPPLFGSCFRFSCQDSSSPVKTEEKVLLKGRESSVKGEGEIVDWFFWFLFIIFSRVSYCSPLFFYFVFDSLRTKKGVDERVHCYCLSLARLVSIFQSNIFAKIVIEKRY